MENKYQEPLYGKYTAPICTPEVDSKLAEISLAVSSMGQGTSRRITREEAIEAFS